MPERSASTAASEGRRSVGILAPMAAATALPALRPRPSGRRVVQGRRHRRPLPRRGRAHRARVLHRRRGGRHPQPGDGQAGGQGRHRRRPPRRARQGGRHHRLRRGRDARLPRLGHARQRGQRQPAQLRPGADGRGGRPARRDHPPHAAAGDPHLRRRAGRLPAPRPHQGARHHPARRRPGRRPRLVPRGGGAVAGVEDLLLGLVAEAHRAHARQVPRARTSSRPSARTGSSGRRRTTASPRRSTSRASPRCASRRCSPTPPRSIPSRRSGSGSRATWPAAIHPYDDYVRATSLVDAPTPEDDLFAGLRAEVNA